MFALSRPIMRSQSAKDSTSCPNSKVMVSAPIFGLASESNEIFAISQSTENLQLVEQTFCDEEMCRNMESCQQVKSVLFNKEKLQAITDNLFCLTK